MSLESFDATVVGGDVVLPELSEPLSADIGIRAGCVAGLLKRGTPTTAARVFDATGKYVFPGGVDPHVHVSWPFLSTRTADTYDTATRAAAAGGTTTIIDFAIEGRDSPAAAVAQRRRQAEGEAVIDFSFHCVISDASERVLEEMAQVAADGITSFKLYMTYPQRGLMVDDATLFSVAERAAEVGGVLGVHAENGVLEQSRLERMQRAQLGRSRHFRHLKPPFVEAEAVARASRIAAAAGARLWILHLSSQAALSSALSVRGETGQPEAVETCPQYLLLDETVLDRSDGHRFLCSPPLRTAADSEALWVGLKAQEINWIATDHCLFLRQQKDDRASAFWECPHGLPGIQTRSALIMRAALRRGLSLSTCARILSCSAAQWFGLYPRKGTLLPGSDADLAIWDSDTEAPIINDELLMGGDWTPYEGMLGIGWPSLVLVRGEPVAEYGRSVAPNGFGHFVARPSKEALEQ
jgi:dihydropyrimidinase